MGLGITQMRRRIGRRKLPALAALLSVFYLRTDAGDDFQSVVMGGGLLDSEVNGNATSITATSISNSGATWVTDVWRGHVVFAGPNNAGTGSRAYGIIVSNTGILLNIDKWYNPDDPGGAAATTPNATANYVIAPGGGPAWWIAFTENAAAPAVTDVLLTAELVVGTSAGLERQLCTWAHTAGASTYTLTKTSTLTGATPRTINKAAVFNSSRDVTGQMMVFATAMPNPPTLVTNDQVTSTYTITI